MRGSISRRSLAAGLALAPIVAPELVRAAGTAQSASLLGLTIGIDAYADLRPLARAVDDAETIHGRLRDLGFQSRCLPNAKRADIVSAVQTLLERANDQSIIFIYYAGHGLEVNGVNYVTAVDTTNQVETFEQSVIPLNGLLGSISRTNPRRVYVVMDACRNNPMPANASMAGGNLAALQVPNNIYMVYAAGSGEFALDDLGAADRCANGVFCRAFNSELNPDTTFDNVVKATRAKVAGLARRVGHSQHAAIYSQCEEDLTIRGEAPRVQVVPTAGSGVISSCHGLVIAVSRFTRGGSEAKPEVLEAPPNDLKVVSSALASAGVKVRALLDPSLAEVRAELKMLVAFEADKKLIYLSGFGLYVKAGSGRELIFPTRDHMSTGTEIQRSSVLSLEELVHSVYDDHRLTLICSDCGLPQRDEFR